MMADLSVATYSVFAALTLLCLGIQFWERRTNTSVARNPSFLTFQRKFCLGYFLALFSDWLQGPYVYKLYSNYGFLESQITLLYIVGFASSGIFGTYAGSLTDRLGRKKTCLAFCVIYAICCVTKISPNFVVLLLGRACGGIATSLLFSAFESWYVYEHTVRYDFPADWMALTFTKTTYWNGLLAIVAGVIANLAAETAGLGPVSPFLIAVPVLALCFIFVANQWDENYGDSKGTASISCLQSLREILSNEIVLLLGVTQALFESVMYMFVFIWTPVLEPGNPPLGMVFACFMVCIMIGSSVYKALQKRTVASETVLAVAIGFVIASMTMCYFATNTHNPHIAIGFPFVAFLVLEVAVGMYFPALSYLRSNIIPESHRAGIMNWFRAPMNLVTCAGLYWLHREDNRGGSHQIFGVCWVLVLIALFFAWRLRTAMAKEKSKSSLFENGLLPVEP